MDAIRRNDGTAPRMTRAKNETKSSRTQGVDWMITKNGNNTAGHADKRKTKQQLRTW